MSSTMTTHLAGSPSAALVGPIDCAAAGDAVARAASATTQVLENPGTGTGTGTRTFSARADLDGHGRGADRAPVHGRIAGGAEQLEGVLVDQIPAVGAGLVAADRVARDCDREVAVADVLRQVEAAGADADGDVLERAG
ncbi:MAG: hypothetical protein A2138_05310 [Deltaproteobacteria bacterium RBG_16_71_12]|nr:MAG: hypothetical protein A2138_05310 [Deltaproteobacteria bacterium RBG_16_71_12]